MKKQDGQYIEILAALLAVGDLLDEILCQLRGTPADEKHQIFGRRLQVHLDQFHKSLKAFGPLRPVKKAG